MSEHAAESRWVSWVGIGLFVALASAGYFYNLTFIQLGVVDLGSRVLELPAGRIAQAMALLAGVTLVVALGTGLVMHRRRWSESFKFKLQLLAAVAVLQTALTLVAPLLRSQTELTVWIVLASIGLGLGVPCLFGLTCDLVPIRHRGIVAAAVTSAAFLPAAVFASDWRIDQFAAQMVWFMIPSTVGLLVLAFYPMASDGFPGATAPPGQLRSRALCASRCARVAENCVHTLPGTHVRCLLRRQLGVHTHYRYAYLPQVRMGLCGV
ncbi:MFS transporter [Nesterenkonia sphaerica]|uniref:MFS transporter n=1 Tax=Nesterenkonia sphaerica TaxID=1804988 RepID=A0A5R9AAV6_9MICC|nr:MFS transporter [Nesterenkonia sphaerica]TLP75768.1 MFS transporter [Nesterenkonia sphaerica]